MKTSCFYPAFYFLLFYTFAIYQSVDAIFWNLLGCSWCGIPSIGSPGPIMSPYVASYPSYPSAIVYNPQPTVTYRQPIRYSTTSVQQSSYNPQYATTSYQQQPQYSNLANNQPYYQNGYGQQRSNNYYQQPARAPYQMNYQEVQKRVGYAGGGNSVPSYNGGDQYATSSSSLSSSYSNNGGFTQASGTYDSDVISSAPYAKSRSDLYGRSQKHQLTSTNNQEASVDSDWSSNRRPSKVNSLNTAHENDKKHNAFSPSDNEIDLDEEAFDKIENTHEENKKKTNFQVNRKNSKVFHKEEDVDDEDFDVMPTEKELLRLEKEKNRAGSDSEVHMRIKQNDKSFPMNEGFIPIGKDSSPFPKLAEAQLTPNVFEKIKKRLKGQTDDDEMRKVVRSSRIIRRIIGEA